MDSYSVFTDAKRLEATENLTALVGLEVLFKAVAATETGRNALHEAMDERLADLDAVTSCGVDPGTGRLIAHLLREMIERVAPLAEAA